MYHVNIDLNHVPARTRGLQEALAYRASHPAAVKLHYLKGLCIFNLFLMMYKATSCYSERPATYSTRCNS